MNHAHADALDEFVCAAIAGAEATFPTVPTDSYSDPAAPGQWMLIEAADDEGLKQFQVRLSDRIGRGIAVRPNSLAGDARRLVQAVADDLRKYVDGAPVVVSRPIAAEPDDGQGVRRSHHCLAGLWLTLLIADDPARGPVAQLYGILGRAPLPLAPADEHIATVFID